MLSVLDKANVQPHIDIDSLVTMTESHLHKLGDGVSFVREAIIDASMNSKFVSYTNVHDEVCEEYQTEHRCIVMNMYEYHTMFTTATVTLTTERPVKSVEGHIHIHIQSTDVFDDVFKPTYDTFGDPYHFRANNGPLCVETTFRNHFGTSTNFMPPTVRVYIRGYTLLDAIDNPIQMRVRLCGVVISRKRANELFGVWRLFKSGNHKVLYKLHEHIVLSS
jgi:hypothetical protein